MTTPTPKPKKPQRKSAAERKRAAEQGDVLRKVAAAFNGWANGSNQGDLATLTALEMIGAALGDPLKGQQP